MPSRSAALGPSSDTPASKVIVPGSRLMHASENLHQRGFARAVVADQRDDFARENVEAQCR
jgi:hypothetical protein